MVGAATSAAADASLTWRGAAELRRLLVPIESLQPWPGNPRRGDIAAISESLKRFGQLRPIVTQGTVVVAGNHLVAAAKQLGWTHLAALDHEFASEQEARGFVLADNRVSQLGTFDDALLAEQLRTFDEGSLTGTGYDDRFVQELERELARAADLDALALGEGADDVPPLPKGDPDSVPGEIYSLGEHRLLCGDARDIRAVRGLVGSCAPELLWTDPPFGVSYTGKTRAALQIQNDSAAGLGGLLADAFAAADSVLVPGAGFYVAAPSTPRLQIEFLRAIESVGWNVHQQLVWVKDCFVLGHSDYHHRHEAVLYGHKPSPGRVGRGNHAGSRWYGDNAQDTVFEIPRPKRSADHPTMKPTALIAAHLRNSTARGDVVFDCFAGSGSTMIACEMLGRRCFAVEVDPAYADVIRKRYNDFVLSSR